MAFKPQLKEKPDKQILAKPEEAEVGVVRAQKSEQEKIPEKKAEQEKIEISAEPTELSAKIKKVPKLLKKKVKSIPQMRDEITIKIEKIMQEGLDDAYQRLSPIAKQEFKLKGEQAALQIRELLRSTHVKAKKLLRLLLDWLRMLPGVNKFFLEQEAKIKADRILSLKN